MKSVATDFLLMNLGINYLFFFTVGFIFENFRNRLVFNKKLILLFFTVSIFQSWLDIFDYDLGALWGVFFVVYVSENVSFDRLRLFNVVVRKGMDIYLYHEPLNFFVIYCWGCTALQYELDTYFGISIYYFMRTVGVICGAILISVCISIIHGYMKNQSCKLSYWK